MVNWQVIGQLIATGVIMLSGPAIIVLLALKKDVDIIQPPTQRGMSDNLMEWKSLGEIKTNQFLVGFALETNNEFLQAAWSTVAWSDSKKIEAPIELSNKLKIGGFYELDYIKQQAEKKKLLLRTLNLYSRTFFFC